MHIDPPPIVVTWGKLIGFTFSLLTLMGGIGFATVARLESSWQKEAGELKAEIRRIADNLDRHRQLDGHATMIERVRALEMRVTDLEVDHRALNNSGSRLP